MISFDSFSTNDEAKAILKSIEENIQSLIADKENMRTSRIIHDEPEVRRVWRQCGDVRVSFHKIFPCNECFFHPHPRPSLIKCIKG